MISGKFRFENAADFVKHLEVMRSIHERATEYAMTYRYDPFLEHCVYVHQVAYLMNLEGIGGHE